MSVRGIKGIENETTIDVEDLEAAILEQFVEDHWFISDGILYAKRSDGYIWARCN